jgi:uncharacterized protein YhaN
MSQPGLLKFIKASAASKNAKLLEQQNNVEAIQNEIQERLAQNRRYAQLIETMTQNEVTDAEITRERDKMRQSIASVYSATADYTRRLLWLELHRTLAIDGFVMPDELIELRRDIDYGLLNVRGLEKLENALDTDDDPFDRLGIKLEEHM